MAAAGVGSGELIATVVPDVSGLDKTFDYLVPDHLHGRVRVGSMVRVVLSGRRVGGWVVRLGPTADVARARIVPLAKWSGLGPDDEIIDLARWAAGRWGTPRLRPFLVAASPPVMIDSLPVPRRDGAALTGEVSDAVARLLRSGGGVVRTSPTDDVAQLLAGIAAAVSGTGATLVVGPSPAEVAALAARLRTTGLRTGVWPAEWAGAAAGGCDVVVGGRNAVWATMPSLGAVVVLDEHDEALQSERTPTWHARDVAIERASRRGLPCVLVSPCPTVTALHWSGRRWLRPALAAEHAGWPRVEVVDRSDEAPWQRSLISSPLIAHLRNAERRVVCVHNTPGRSRMLACRACHALVVCERCEAAVEQPVAGVLRCRRCATQRPPVCQQCGSGALANVRPGVARLRDELQAAANRVVVSVTSDSPVVPGQADVYVGTEAVLHRVAAADVVAFLDLDAELLAPRYRAAEHAMSLLVRAARLVGPRAAAGSVLVQTFMPRHPVIAAAVLSDPGRLTKVEAARRRDLDLPPFSALGRVGGSGAAEFVAATGLQAAPDGDGLLVRARSWDELGPVLAATPRPPGSRLRIEVDPARR